MTKCVFCGRDESPYKGLHLIRNTGTVDFFCSSKCRKNATKLKRDKRKVRWTEASVMVRKKKVEEKAKAEEKIKAENKK